MKKTLLALSLLTASGLVADQYYNDACAPEPVCPEPVCQPCAPCKPCCVPQPKKCIDRECYTPNFYDLQCAWGAFFSVDFLYWFARENNMPFALDYTRQPIGNATGTAQSAFAPFNYHYVKTKWKPGVRVAIGSDYDWDGWDTGLIWTWNKNTRRTTAAVNYSPTSTTNFDMPALGTDGLINPWVNASMLGSPTSSSGQGVLTFDTVRAKWKFTLNQLDLEVGKKYWLSRHFTMRPYAGVRGAWTKTRFETLSTLNTTALTGSTLNNFARSFKDRFDDQYWGAGLLAGFQPNWYFGCSNSFSLYANFEASLIYGKYKTSKRESYSQIRTPIPQTIPPTETVDVAFVDNSFDTFFMMQPILDLALGFSWADNWCQDRYRTEFDIGWEHHIWFRSNHRLITQVNHFSSSQNTFSTYDTVISDLMFGGLVVRFRIDF